MPSDTYNKIGVLFVCLGNICRSPVAEGVFTHLVDKQNLQPYFHIDSCGTAGYHIGELPHPQTRQVAEKNGITLTSRGRQFQADDFLRFDYILAMDSNNYADLASQVPEEKLRQRLYMFRAFDPNNKKKQNIDMPDPYYGGLSGFENVYEIALRTCQHLLNELVIKHKFKAC